MITLLQVDYIQYKMQYFLMFMKCVFKETNPL